MSRSIKLAAVFFLALTIDHAAAAELFSVRCEGAAPDLPYFATIDVDTNAVVFETPPSRADTTFGINTIAGEITSTKNDKIDFTLDLRPGKLNLIFARGPKTMTWPGLLDGTFRPKLIHRCSVTPARSILSFRSRDPIQDPISVRCNDNGYMYFTMDAASKRAIFERGKLGRVYRGEVTGVHQDEITLSMNFDTPRQVVWNKSRQTITVEAIEGDSSQPRTVLQCEEIAPRTMIDFYEIIKR